MSENIFSTIHSSFCRFIFRAKIAIYGGLQREMTIFNLVCPYFE